MAEGESAEKEAAGADGLTKALREANERLRLHLEHSPLATLEWDKDYVLIRWSKAAERVYGWSAEEVLGKSWGDWKFVHEDDRDEVARVAKQAIDEGSSTCINRNYNKAGDILHCAWFNTVLLDQEGKVKSVLSQVQDVTEQKKLEKRLRQSQKMESLGQLAGGIAHDFNNILLTVVANTELAKRSLHDRDAVAAHLDDIQRASERASRLTRQLLTMSRQAPVKLQVIDLNQQVNETVRLLSRVIREDIQLKIHLDKSNPSITADAGQIGQVLMNLCVNARDAMSQGGELSISTEFVPAKDPDKHGWAELAVTDTGEGMESGVKDRAFDPFFTTKPVGKGTGLGLAVVHGIVKQYGGHVEIESEPGRGTTISVRLPSVPGHADEPQPSSSSDVPGGSETILIVEDEESVRASLQGLLEFAGYTVITAVDGEDALRKFDDNRDQIKGIVLDVVMPRLGGRGVYDQLMARGCTAPVLISSGHSAVELPDSFIAKHGLKVLSKPYVAEELWRVLRSLLDASTTTGD